MKALMYLGDQKLEVTERPDPQGAFLVRVSACTVCGTDLKTWLRGHPGFPPPCILGHEFIGTVERAPKGSGFHKGCAVAVAPYGECGVCELCRSGAGELCRHKHRVSSGAFCELVEVPEAFVPLGVIPLDSPDEAYTLTEPLACVLTALERLRIRPDSRVLIAGGGPMGALFALTLAAGNVEVRVSEPNALRRERLIQLGIAAAAPDAVDASAYDNIVVAVNLPELVAQYVSTIADNGTVHVFAGMPAGAAPALDAYALHYRGVTVTGSSGFHLAAFHRAHETIQADPAAFRRLITHRFPLEKALEAFETQREGRAFKVLLHP